MPQKKQEMDKAKECKNCKHYNSVKIGCKHLYWDKCVIRDADDFVIDHVYQSLTVIKT